MIILYVLPHFQINAIQSFDHYQISDERYQPLTHRGYGDKKAADFLVIS